MKLKGHVIRDFIYHSTNVNKTGRKKLGICFTPQLNPNTKPLITTNQPAVHTDF